MEVKNVKRLSNTRQLRDFARIASENQYRKILITRTNTVLSNPLKEAGWELIKAIPHKERTAKRSEKRYNKEVKKQLMTSLISDELGQASTKKSSVIRRLIPSKRAKVISMNKNDFLLAVHEYLKAFGYRKNKSYWFLSNGELVYCVYVQSSQWDANDYYVEVGIAIEEIVGPKPSVTRWHVRKRCEDESQNDRNISLSVLKQAIDFFSDIHTVNDLTLYLERTPHTLVGLQYELFSNT